MKDLIKASALEQGARIGRGEVSVTELTRHYLDRIEAFDPRYNAFVQLEPERALATAKAMDRARSRSPGERRGPLWGLPTAMKDLHMTRGFFARVGSRAYRYAWSPIDDVSSAAVR